MKLRITLFTVAMAMASFAKAQDVSVEKIIFGIQTGYLGAWVHNESRVSNEFALRSEIGLNAGLFGGTFVNVGFLLTPVITAEPRWYYNLEKRNEKGKNIINNSANFLTAKISYRPEWFVISNDDNVGVADQISIIPKWAIKRSIGDHFTFETGIGLGYRYYFWKRIGFQENEGEAALDLHIRLGYTF